jgi:hypothetical protein
MINFDFKGIRIEATARLRQHTYQDVRKGTLTRFEREVEVCVHFWDFRICDHDFHDLAFVKSTLQYFLQSYWKRSNKSGGKINLAKALHQEHPHGWQQSLLFNARQKNNQHFLHICMQAPATGAIVKEVYLDGQEVMLLDIALNKAIGILSPATIYN